MAGHTQYPFSTLPGIPDDRRSALEQALVPVARSAALGDLAADVGHDLANPLFAVIALVDLLLHDDTIAPPARERLRLVQETAAGLKESLRTLLDFARPPEGPQTALLADAARMAVSLVRRGHAKELEANVTCPAAPVAVRCPPGALTQAALHLVAAGRAAAGDRGSIDVEVTAEGALRVRPALADGLGIAAAGRIALDHGGTLTRDGDGWTLLLPLAS